MKGNAPQAPITQKVQPEVKEVPQTPQQPSVNSLIPPKPPSPIKPKKRSITIILVVLIIVVGLGVGGYFIWKYFFASETSVPLLERIVDQKKEEEISIYKGIWTPTLLIEDPNYLDSNAQKLKDLGINTIFIAALPPLSESDLEKIGQSLSPELVEIVREMIPNEEELVINFIQTAHRNGFKVALTVGDPPGLRNIDWETMNLRIVEVAKLAEKYDVELFAPLNEADKYFTENVGEWRQEILPKIKKVYHGDILWKGAGIGLPEKELTDEFLKELSERPPGDFSGYDYRGYSSLLLPEEQTIEEYTQNVDDVLKYVLALAKKDGCKGVMIAEFGVLQGGPWSEEEIARAYEIVLEKGKDEVVGFFAFSEPVLGVELPGMVIEENPKAQEVIREWYTEILPEKKLIVY